MKKMFTRIAACSLAVLIAFNSALVPRSKAVGAEVVGTAALATSTLAAYMTATGVPLTVVSGGAAAASAGAASLISGYAAATGGTYSVVTTAIASGVTIGTGGVIVIGVVAAAILAGIVAWAINEYDLEAETPKSVYKNTHGVFLADGTPVAIPVIMDEYNVNEFTNAEYTLFDLNEEYTFANGAHLSKVQPVTYATGFILTDSTGDKRECRIWGENQDLNDALGYFFFIEAAFPDSVKPCLVYTDGYIHAGSMSLSRLGGNANSSSEMECQLNPDYQPMPELAPLEQIEIQPNLAPEIAPEAVPDAILGKIVSGDFAPSYRVIPVTNPNPEPEPEPEPDPEPDPDPNVGIDLSGILEWLKRIWDAIKAIPELIAEAVKNIFVPDAALTTEITDAFAEKFAFVPTLHRLGTDLLSIGPDSKPPVVYIHLEDAEGSIDYGGTVKALDMSWYQRYKEDGDRIMSGFLWISFLWLLFKRVPAIIRGAEMISESSNDFRDNYEDLMFNADHNLDSRGRPIK